MYVDKDKEISDLEDEIELLKKRVASLEKKENVRKSVKYLKIIVKLILLGLIIFGAWRAYDYVVHGIPNMISEKIQDINPFKRK